MEVKKEMSGRYFTSKSKKKADAFIKANTGKGFYVKKLKKNYAIYKD